LSSIQRPLPFHGESAIGQSWLAGDFASNQAVSNVWSPFSHFPLWNL
jgi:hypothetical protein